MSNSGNQIQIDTECSDCGGTGLYCGFAEARGEAVICMRCDGTGKMTVRYKPFTGRKPRNDVYTVRRSRGSLLATGVGGVGQSISYSEFAAGKMPR